MAQTFRSLRLSCAAYRPVHRQSAIAFRVIDWAEFFSFLSSVLPPFFLFSFCGEVEFRLVSATQTRERRPLRYYSIIIWCMWANVCLFRWPTRRLFGHMCARLINKMKTWWRSKSFLNFLFTTVSFALFSHSLFSCLQASGSNECRQMRLAARGSSSTVTRNSTSRINWADLDCWSWNKSLIMLLLSTVKLVLIALNILPYRITHRKVLFLMYLITMVTHGK